MTICTMANGIVGKWKTIDDSTGEPKSVVEIVLKDNKLYGTVIELVGTSDPDATCEDCKGELKDQPVLGMQIINGLTLDDDEWVGDDGILDPGNGKTYDVKIWREGDVLKVRGYIGFVYRTQEWLLVK